MSRTSSGNSWTFSNTFLVTKIVAVGAIEILAAGEVVKLEFPLDLEGQIGCSYLMLLFDSNVSGRRSAQKSFG